MIATYDAAVIGGGPAGTIAAALLAGDRDVVVIEEHSSSGTPMQCAGLVTQDVADMFGVRPDILNSIRGADVVFPSGGKFEVRSEGVKALLIDRSDLDRKLAERATDKGVEIRYGTKYSGHRVSGDGVSVSTSTGEIRSRLIIGADGHSSKVASSLRDNRPKEYVYGIGADVKLRSEHDDVMTLRIGSEFAPGFFSWEIPFGDMTRIGLCMSAGAGGTPNDHLKKLMAALGTGAEDIVSKYAGKIPLGGRPRTYGERTLLIGDAAGQVKPVSGGGLYPICKAAPILGRIAGEALRDDSLTAKHLSRYEKEWKKEIGKELSRGYRIRRMFTNLSDKDLDKIFRIINRDDMRSILSGIDLDNPSSVASPMLRNPQVGIRFLPLMMRAMI
ncbi:MAG: NAD(P)/FAD-dependent oxidoreductase [Candidatus Methanoplasma sp.]|jgi:geranylgeranyl reductase family protein|nr:NAD(P)/FAD-dependent oxidoreductase [Candidatus Methanoplasma sp.]